MSNSKNYNSIVFLTTLSVYLGLVLIGAPPILAQAALARQFDIQNEIEVKDDLDKKPDDETCSELKAKTKDADNQFIEQFAKSILALLKKNYLPESSGYEVEINASGAGSDELFHNFFSTLRKELIIDDFSYSLNKNTLSANLNLKSKYSNDISHYLYAYNSSLNSLSCETQNKPENVILKNTKITFENNQVFIVTRLPRGSLDALIAEKNAQ